jgi:1,2-diacylglycerol 3-beta-galactosyltransferase
MAKRVLFLISDTGGGHRASANALAEALDRLPGRAVHCEAVDLLATYAHWPLTRLPAVYQPLIDRYEWLWRMCWRAGEQPTVWNTTTRMAQAWHARRFQRLFAEHPADLVVSVHPLLNHAPLAAVRRWLPGTPFVTVVTDLATAHPVWFAADVDLLVAPCDEARRTARAVGVPAERIRMTGLPISLRFFDDCVGRSEARRILGLMDRPTVLILGGGEGMGPVQAIAQAVSAALASIGGQAIVICGRNAALRRRLCATAWPAPVHVLGFVDNMPRWMQAADCLVTKAGPGTIAEGLACGLPMVLSGYIYGQEAGNVAYVQRHGVGVFASDPSEIAHIVVDWLQPGNRAVVEMQQKARALAKPRAALEIATILSELFLLYPLPNSEKKWTTASIPR